MGLDTSHNCWHGPYSSFNEFRYKLAEQIGINLNEYIGYGDEKAVKTLDSIEHDIRPLLNHSDCDGTISVEDAKKISRGLSSILSKQTSTEEQWIKHALQFIDGCNEAIEKNEEIDFH